MSIAAGTARPSGRGHPRRLAALGAVALLAFGPAAFADPVVVVSPNGRVKAELSADGGALRYSVSVDGDQVLGPSSVAVQSDGAGFGKEGTLGTPQTREVNETYPFLGGKARAVNHAREATVPVDTGGQAYALDLHVADDGVAVRLRLPAKAGRKVEADSSTWKLPPTTAAVWATQYDAGYEQPYRTLRVRDLSTRADYGLPLTAKVHGKYVTLTEALLKDYGDLSVRARRDGSLVGSLPNDPKGWTTDAEVVQPWRVTVVAHDLTELVNSTLVQNLNPPPDAALANADWIRPGRSTWQWMAVGNPRFEDQHQWVDWTRSLGYEYYLVDDGWAAWKDPWPSLASVVAYAKAQNVKVWLWVNSKQVRDPEPRRAYFRHAADIGIAGVKVDFPQATNRWWSNWYPDAARDAADCKLLIDFHGATKPTGMERTWPNELTREGVRGHEYHITRYGRLQEPQHDTILPFTRYVAGHGDYTPTVLEPKELQGNTWAHEVAQAVVFTSPFLCTGGNPKDYLANPARDVIAALPATWDETVVLPDSEPGKLAGMARRHGDQWFIGVMTGGQSATVDIPLAFLSPGDWKATRLGDVLGKDDAWDRADLTVNPQASLHVPMASRGGFVAWIRK